MRDAADEAKEKTMYKLKAMPATPMTEAEIQRQVAFVSQNADVCELFTEQDEVESRPLLGQDATEARRLAYGGRQIRSLKESKPFDTERLNESPLFREKGRLF